MNYPNLKAEMARHNITNDDIAEMFGKTRFWIDNRTRGKVSISVTAAIQIRDRFFPGFELEYLFAQKPIDPIKTGSDTDVYTEHHNAK